MAKEQWKRIGVGVAMVGILISVMGSVTGLAYLGGSRVATVEGNIAIVEQSVVNVVENASEDRKDIEKLNGIADYLKQEMNDAKLRDARISGQYSNIESYMRNESLKTKAIVDDFKDYRKEQQSQTKAIIEIQGQVRNLERVD